MRRRKKGHKSRNENSMNELMATLSLTVYGTFKKASTSGLQLETVLCDNEVEEADGCEEEAESLTKEEETKESCEHFAKYPYKVWEAVGGHIRPEDVLTFALICRDSYEVTRSRSFWSRLVNRHGGPTTLLPNKSRVEVIRGLFCFYEPLRTVLSRSASIAHPNKLLGLVCINFWSDVTRDKRGHRVNLKFSRPFSRNKKPRKKSPVASDWTLLLEDDEEEEEDDFHKCEAEAFLLQADSPNYFKMPSEAVYGLRLLNVCQTVTGEGFRYQKISLRLGPPYLRPGQTTSNYVDFDLNYVASLKILPWYHPLFK